MWKYNEWILWSKEYRKVQQGHKHNKAERTYRFFLTFFLFLSFMEKLPKEYELLSAPSGKSTYMLIFGFDIKHIPYLNSFLENWTQHHTHTKLWVNFGLASCSLISPTANLPDIQEEKGVERVRGGKSPSYPREGLLIIQTLLQQKPTHFLKGI